jgi:hypothetical protein
VARDAARRNREIQAHNARVRATNAFEYLSSYDGTSQTVLQLKQNLADPQWRPDIEQIGLVLRERLEQMIVSVGPMPEVA